MNYQKKLEKIISDIGENKRKKEKLFIHSCCAPCSSYVLEYLNEYFQISLYYYNPNIYPEEEYGLRIREQKEIIESLDLSDEIKLIEGPYKPEDFYKKTKGYEKDQEGGQRCFLCYEMRLRETAKLAKEKGFDYFATTLSISPHKNAEKLNEIGERLGTEFGIDHLPSDFKKNNGYKRSIELSKKFGLYRQDYCGCIYSQK